MVFHPYRYDYQNKLLKKIQSELSFDNNGVPCDNVSMLLILDKDGYLVCAKCCAATRQSSGFCYACQYDNCNFLTREELYNYEPSCHLKAKVAIILGEVIDCNPCSYETIIKVFQNLLKQAKDGELQKWKHIGFDSVPQQMALELIQSLIQCNDCLEVFDVCETLKQQHCEQKHPYQNLDSLTFEMYFGKILLASGQGDMEKNLLLAIIQMCKKIFFGYRL